MGPACFAERCDAEPKAGAACFTEHYDAEGEDPQRIFFQILFPMSGDDATKMKERIDIALMLLALANSSQSW